MAGRLYGMTTGLPPYSHHSAYSYSSAASPAYPYDAGSFSGSPWALGAHHSQPGHTHPQRPLDYLSPCAMSPAPPLSFPGGVGISGGGGGGSSGAGGTGTSSVTPSGGTVGGGGKPLHQTGTGQPSVGQTFPGMTGALAGKEFIQKTKYIFALSSHIVPFSMLN